MNLEGKNIVLTGASSGIGKELVFLLQEKGAHILALGLEAYDFKLERVLYLQKDISTQAALDQVFDLAHSFFGPLDIFIANAGFTYYEGIEKANWEKTQKIYETNVFSPIYSFLKVKELKDQDAFHFVVTASAMSFMPLAGHALYSGSKHALHGFFEAARFELPKHQKISLIYPITTKTNFFKQDAPIPFPAHSPKKVAKRYIKGIEKEEKRIFTSKMFWLDNHLKLVQKLIQRREKKNFENWKKRIK